MLTAQKLDEMQRVNIGAVAADTLADVSGLRLDNTLSRKGAAGPFPEHSGKSLLLLRGRRGYEN